jgi:uncharacterized protein
MSIRMNRRNFLGAVGGATALGAMAPRMAMAQGVNIDMATMGVGSAWYQYGISLSQYIGAGLPSGSIVTVRDFAGGDGNLRLIEADQRVQLGMTFSMNVAWARNRMTEITDATADNVRLIAGGLDQYYVGMVAQTSIGVRSVSEILDAGRGLRVSTSQAGSTSDIGALQILAAHGVDEAANNARGGSYARVSLQAASENMITGRSDVWVQMIVAGHPRVSELSFSHNIRLLGMSEEAMANMQAAGFGRAEMPAGTFNGMDEPVVMPGASTILIANAAMDDDVAYRITRAIIDNMDALKAENAGFRDWTLQRAADVEAGGGAPLHPGAERAYREAGVI